MILATLPVLYSLIVFGSGPVLAGSSGYLDEDRALLGSKIAAGYLYTLAVRSDGTLWSWGRNNYGQLGLGNTTDRSSPTQVGTDNMWVAVTAGGFHSLALKSDGTLWSWGRNNLGQLGLGDNTDRLSPTQVGTDNRWAAVTAGTSHSLALKSDGTLWSWGYNGYGQLGLGDTTNRESPTQVGTDNRWAAVTAGASHSLALKSDGTLWSWGYNGYGALGLGYGGGPVSSPTQVGTDNRWAAVTAGEQTLALKSDGTLWSWGYNGYGQLGLGDTTNRESPTQVGTDNSWVAVTAEGYHTLALKSDGTLWSWGQNDEGQLGLGYSGGPILIPTQVGTDNRWVAVANHHKHSLAVKSDGTLWSWGHNDEGQLGLGDKTDRHSPVQVQAFSIFTPSSVCGVEVTIENALLEGYPSQVLEYTIDVHNSGNVMDNIILSYIPDGWPDITIDPLVLTDVMPSEHRQATMFVHVLDNAMGCTYKEITVLAESQFCGATDNDTATAHVQELCGVEVTIEWIRQFGTSPVDRAYGMAVGGSDNIYVAGLTFGTLPGQTSAGSGDAFVRKYDGSGNELWTRQFGSSADDYAMGVAVDSSDNVYITGITWGALPAQVNLGSTDAFVRKYDGDGNEIWTRQFGTSAGDRATGVVVDGSNNIYVMGYTDGTLPGQTSSGGRDAFIRKYDSAGNEIWTRQFGTSALDDVRDVAVDSSDNVYVAGLTLGALPGQENLGNYDAFVRKYDGAGNEIWTIQFGTSDEDYGYGVAVDGSDNVYVAGDTKGALPGQTFSGGRDGFIRKYDGDGNELWTIQFGTSDIDRAGGVTVDGSNNAYLLGITSGTFPGQTSSGGYDAFVREYDSAGNEIWTRQCGSSADEYVSSVAVDSSGKVYASGYTYGTLPGQTPSDNVDAFLVKFAVFTGGIEVTIENTLLEGYPSQMLEYTIDVHNSGNVVDNIILSYIPDGWPDITIVPQVLTDVAPCEVRQATMFVHVPDNAIGCTYKEITVVAESQFCGATDNDTTQAHVTEIPGIVEELHLIAGWNLVCFPVTAVTNTPETIFAGLTWGVDYTIYSWTAPGGPYILIGPTDVLQDNLGYWVLVTSDQTITWNGTQPTSRDVYLVTGWNMAGFPVVNGSTTPTNIFTGMTWGVDYNIYWWTAPGGPYILLGPTDLFLDNTGYWVYVNADKIVTVP